MFLNKKLLSIIGAAGLALAASACSSSSDGNIGVCTTTNEDGSAACEGTTNIDYGSVDVSGLEDAGDTLQQICEDAGNTWSDHCATDTVCVYEDDAAGITYTYEIGASADDTVDTADEELAFACEEAFACDALGGTFDNSLGVTTTDGTDGDCAE